MEDFVFGAELGLGSDLGMGDISVDVNNLNVIDLDDDDASGPIEPDTEEYVILNDNFLKGDRLTRTDFGRLEPGKWLSDNLIDLFIRYPICQQASTIDAYQSFQVTFSGLSTHLCCQRSSPPLLVS